MRDTLSNLDNETLSQVYQSITCEKSKRKIEEIVIRKNTGFIFQTIRILSKNVKEYKQLNSYQTLLPYFAFTVGHSVKSALTKYDINSKVNFISYLVWWIKSFYYKQSFEENTEFPYRISQKTYRTKYIQAVINEKVKENGDSVDPDVDISYMDIIKKSVYSDTTTTGIENKSEDYNDNPILKADYSYEDTLTRVDNQSLLPLYEDYIKHRDAQQSRAIKKVDPRQMLWDFLFNDDYKGMHRSGFLSSYASSKNVSRQNIQAMFQREIKKFKRFLIMKLGNELYEELGVTDEDELYRSLDL